MKYKESIISKHSFEMIKIEGEESFVMGNNRSQHPNEKPEHEVVVSTYYLGKYPVTQELWEAVMGENPSYFCGRHRPVENVSWEDVQEFLKKLNQKTRRNYRLPTEAEWEYAAKGGKLSKGYPYAGSSNLEEVGWSKENSNGETHPIGQKQPNELGLYDMSGNVWEWCWDWYQTYDEQVLNNPKGPTSGVDRVVRGGSWLDYPQDCQISSRNYWRPGGRLNVVGFRLACSFDDINYFKNVDNR